MINLYDYSLNKLEDLVVSLGEKKFRATQIFKWVYKRGVTDFDEMSDISKTFREKLKSDFTFVKPQIFTKQINTPS